MALSDCTCGGKRTLIFSFCVARGVSALCCDSNDVYFVVFIDQDASSLHLNSNLCYFALQMDKNGSPSQYTI